MHVYVLVYILLAHVFAVGVKLIAECLALSQSEVTQEEARDLLSQLSAVSAWGIKLHSYSYINM